MNPVLDILPNKHKADGKLCKKCFFCRYIFLEFQSHHEASEAVKATDGYKLDKQHTFAVNLFSDFDK